MSVHTTTTRPAGKSAGAAAVGVLLTLAIFALAFLAFLIAPLLALGVAFLAFAIMAPKKERAAKGPSESAGATSAHDGQSAAGFGAGAQ